MGLYLRANGTREGRKERLVVSLNADGILSRGYHLLQCESGCVRLGGGL